MYLKIIQKYYQEGSEQYNILISHSESVANKALLIAAKHHELGIDTQFVKEAAMLHDIGVFLTNAPGICCYGECDYIEHGYLGAELLRKENLPRHALVCERHTGTGLTKETIVKNGWNIPCRDMLPISIEEQLICYADLFFSKTKLNSEHSIDNISRKLMKYGEQSELQFRRWLQFFSI